MATWTGQSQTPAILNAAETWKRRCFLGNGSVLGEEPIWTKDNVDALKKLFVDNPILGGDRNFYDKLQEQISSASPIIKKLAAEAIWLLLLFVSERSFSVEKKRERLAGVWAQSGEPLPVSTLLADQVLSGLARPGPAFLTMMWMEFGYLLQVISAWKALPATRQEDLLRNNTAEITGRRFMPPFRGCSKERMIATSPIKRPAFVVASALS